MSARTIPAALLAVVCIAALLVAGCTSPTATPVPTPTPTTPTMTPAPLPAGKVIFTEADSGGTFPLALGAVIQIRLAENPTTGYQWNLSITSGLVLLNETYLPDDPTGKLVGSGGTHVWFIQAAREGEQGVSAFYARPWEPAGPGVTFFTLTLPVAGSCGENACTVTTPPVTVPPRYPVYTEADSGKTVQEPLGETFGIRLQTNPSTGYSWNLSLTKGLSLSREEYIAPATEVGRVGAGGVQSYTLVTTARGGQLVRAEYRQPWVAAGTVTYLNLEGGFYGILGDDGRKYDPLNMDADFQKDGLRVAFHATEAQGAMSSRMWGTPVTLDFIAEIPVFTLNVTVT